MDPKEQMCAEGPKITLHQKAFEILNKSAEKGKAKERIGE